MIELAMTHVTWLMLANLVGKSWSVEKGFRLCRRYRYGLIKNKIAHCAHLGWDKMKRERTSQLSTNHKQLYQLNPPTPARQICHRMSKTSHLPDPTERADRIFETFFCGGLSFRDPGVSFCRPSRVAVMTTRLTFSAEVCWVCSCN